jgi:hypothetical protein
LFISKTFKKAGAGTLFFQSVVDSLLYSEHYKLQPWVHINDASNRHCYDSSYHGRLGKNYTLQHLTGHITHIRSKDKMKCPSKPFTRPGPPSGHVGIAGTTQNVDIIGNGLWNSYFEPVLPTMCNDEYDLSLCLPPELPIYEMTLEQIIPGMHRCSEFGVRGWPFKGIPEALLPQPTQTIQDWLWTSRERAARIVQKYYKPLPWLVSKIDQANPFEECLAVHIRLTDKGSGRDKKGLEYYQPYIEAYADAMKATDNAKIYIATDDGTVVPTIQQSWSAEISKRIIVQPNVVRSNTTQPTFALLKNDKHRSNTEVLVEMYAMSKCQYFVHGFSGMAEAVVYINPALHHRSVNVDDPNKPTPTEFRNLIDQ